MSSKSEYQIVVPSSLRRSELMSRTREIRDLIIKQIGRFDKVEYLKHTLNMSGSNDDEHVLWRWQNKHFEFFFRATYYQRMDVAYSLIISEDKNQEYPFPTIGFLWLNNLTDSEILNACTRWNDNLFLL